MKTIYFTFFLSLIITSNIFSTEGKAHSENELFFATKFTEFYNHLLTNQAAIQRINLLRPKIYIYTDFGGGKNKNSPLVDLQTSGEITSAAWKGTLQQELYINDSAEPLSPIRAAVYLAKTFPYEEAYRRKTSIHTIVVHVVDPGVGNDLDEVNPQPRSIILRKDGVLFIGPDNGSLSFVCPPESIEGSWEINTGILNSLSGENTNAGGTFHGRDVFCEAAFRIAAGIVSPSEIGTAYENLEIKNRTAFTTEHQRLLDAIYPLEFARVHTERFIYDATFSDEKELFEKAFLLGIVQSPLYPDDRPVALTQAKKLFIPDPNSLDLADPLVAIVNHKNGNVFIGPNNGLGSSFIKHFSEENIEIFSLTKQLLESIKNENNNEVVLSILKEQTPFNGCLVEIDFLGDQADLIKDQFGRPNGLKAKVWVDLYGNIKTTVPSTVLNEVKLHNASATVTLNGVKKQVCFADTFSQVPSGQLFLYNGSSGAIGPNPHRSKRYVELTANGVFGKFGIDFFEKNKTKPRSGDIIYLDFEYPDTQ